MTAKLNWQTTTKGIAFELFEEGGSAVPIDNWGLYKVESISGAASVGPLLARIEDENYAEISATQVVFNHNQIALLDDNEVAQLGLPAAAPFRLEIRGQGILSAPTFKLSSQFIDHKGRPVIGLKRDGSLVKVGSKQYTLLEPIYSIVEGVKRFEEVSPQNMDERFLSWAELKLLLPEDAVVAEQLRNMNIVRADAFTLDVKDDDQFDPILLTKTDAVQDLEEEPYQQVLPEAHQTTFAERFESLKQAKEHYALGGGWYVLVPEKLKQRLQVVHEAKRWSPEKRRSFISNPNAYLNEGLYEDQQQQETEELFQETPTFLSDRIQCLGEWHPKLCAYVMQRPSQWLPPEEIILNVPIQSGVLKVPIKDLPDAIEKLHEAVDSGAETVKVGDQEIPANQDTLDALNRLIKPDKEPTDTDTEEEKITKEQLVPILIDNLDELGFEAKQQARVGSVGGFPASLKSSPYLHQSQGINWLQSHWVEGSPGALLADDMGLGKTLQTLTFLSWLRENMQRGEYPPKTMLIVAPTGLLKNWEDEEKIHLVSPGLGNMLKAYGATLKQFNNLSQSQRRNRFASVDWALTTYETLRDKIHYFLNVPWSVVVFDEAQKIKNPTSRMTEMAKSLKADFTLLLTGTPVENRLADLWCILDAAQPGLLGSLKEFHNTYEKPAVENPEEAKKLKTCLQETKQPPIMLRRMKEDHLDGLPDKKSIVIEEPMPPIQAENYQSAVAQGQMVKGNRGAMLKVLHELRQHSLLGVPITGAGLTDEIVQSSARLKAAIAVLDQIHQKGEKVLIFLESLMLQELLLPFLQARYQLPKPPLRISGEVGGGKRKQRVDEFQSGGIGQFDVMLLSPKAGGVGLTLTAANHVIHLSRWWNPAVEDQCTDRIYRIGQKNNVTVYYPQAVHPTIGDHSFDVKLHQLLESKRELSRSALMPPVSGKKDTEDLFNSVI